MIRNRTSLDKHQLAPALSVPAYHRGRDASARPWQRPSLRAELHAPPEREPAALGKTEILEICRTALDAVIIKSRMPSPETISVRD
jgi:hypothetical protein